ncbi:MAG: hypothetical protein ACRYGR_06980 [Janthinobacterium lividum]
MVDYDTDYYEPKPDRARNDKARFAYYMLICFNEEYEAADRVYPHHKQYAMQIANNWKNDAQVEFYKREMLSRHGISAFLKTDDEIEYELTALTQKPHISFSERLAANGSLRAFRRERIERAARELQMNGGGQSLEDEIMNDPAPVLLPKGEA